MAETKKIEEVTMGEIIDAGDFRDPKFWCCCLVPFLMIATVILGLFYRFVLWAFFQ